MGKGINPLYRMPLIAKQPTCLAVTNHRQRRYLSFYFPQVLSSMVLNFAFPVISPLLKIQIFSIPSVETHPRFFIYQRSISHFASYGVSLWPRYYTHFNNAILF